MTTRTSVGSDTFWGPDFDELSRTDPETGRRCYGGRAEVDRAEAPR